MFILRRGAVACLAMLAIAPGCTSLLTPRPHRLMLTTRQMTEAAPLPVALPRELQKSVLPEYRVAPGDVVLVEPVDFNSPIRLPPDQRIQPDGTIDLNQFGQLMVTGMSLDEIQAAVEEKVAAQLGKAEPIHARLTEPESQVFYVLGEVNSPTAYPLIGRETILDAIVTAGGLTDNADQHSIILARPTQPESCRSVLPICYRHIVELGDTSTNYQVMPGDRIYVPSIPITSQVYQFIFPTHGERCPSCADDHRPCPPQAAPPGEWAPTELAPAELSPAAPHEIELAPRPPDSAR